MLHSPGEQKNEWMDIWQVFFAKSRFLCGEDELFCVWCKETKENLSECLGVGTPEGSLMRLYVNLSGIYFGGL